MPLRAAGLTCREVVEVVTGYVEGTLSRRERRRVEAHLARCDGCTAYVEQMRVTILATGRVTEESLAPRVREELTAAFRDWNTARQ